MRPRAAPAGANAISAGDGILDTPPCDDGPPRRRTRRTRRRARRPAIRSIMAIPSGRLDDLHLVRDDDDRIPPVSALTRRAARAPPASSRVERACRLVADMIPRRSPAPARSRRAASARRILVGVRACLVREAHELEQLPGDARSIAAGFSRRPSAGTPRCAARLRLEEVELLEDHSSAMVIAGAGRARRAQDLAPSSGSSRLSRARARSRAGRGSTCPLRAVDDAAEHVAGLDSSETSSTAVTETAFCSAAG